MTTSTQTSYRFRTAIILMVSLFCASRSNAQLTGTKNIPGDYATLGLAIAALNTNGVGAGGVTLNVIAGNNQVAPAAAGTGSVAGAVGAGYVINVTTNAPTAANPVTIQGNGNRVTATALSTASNWNDAIFTIAGTSYVTINNFVLRDSSANTTTAASNNMTEIGIAIVRGNGTTLGSQNCTISNCTIQLSVGAAYTNTIGIYSNSSNSYNNAYTGVTAATSSAGAMSNNSFYSNTISGVTCGITLIGTAAFNDVGNTIGASSQGNSITLAPRTANMTMTTAFANYVKTRQDGIFTINNNSFAINYNTISMATGGTTNTPDNGIFTSTSAAGAYINTVTFNTISMVTATALIAINGINNGSGNSSATLKLNSNTIHDTATTGANIAIQNTTAQSTGNINSNTITQKNTTGSTTAISNTVAVTSLNINSNSITQNTTTATSVGITNSGAVTTLNINSNNPINMTNTTGSVSVIANSGAVTLLSIASNNVTVTQGATATAQLGMISVAGVSVPTGFVSNNTLNLTTASSTTFLGIYYPANASVSANIDSNTVTLTNTGTGNVWALYSSGKDSLLNFLYNSITANVKAQMIGIGQFAATTPASLNINRNTIDISTTVATTTGVYFIDNGPTGPDHAGIYDSICYNIFKCTGTLSNTSGALFFILHGYMNPLDYIIGNTTSGTITKSGSGGAVVIGIDDQGSTASSSFNTTYISNNNISNVHLSGTDSFAAYYVAISSSQAMVISNDTASGIIGGSGYTQGIIFDYCAASTQVTNNYIYNNSGTGTVTGITNEARPGNASTACTGGIISGNKISNLSSSGASAQVYGILENSTAANNVFNIYNDTILNLSVSGNTAPVIYGIYMANALTNNTYSNLLHDFTATTTSGNDVINGIYCASGTTQNLYKNNLYNLSAGTGAGASSQVIGLNLASTVTTFNVYNNFVTALTASSSNNPNAIIGLWAQNNGSTFNIFYNTIGMGIGGSAITSSATNFGTAGILFGNLTSTVMTLKNNIIYMNVTPKGTGISAAIQRNFTGTAFTPISNSFFVTNNNIYYTNSSTKNYLYIDVVTGGAGTKRNGYAMSGLTPDGTNNIANDGNFNLCSGSFKTFLGSGRDGNTYSENNLVAGGLTGTYAPSGSSYAYGTGVTITSPSITDDFSAVSRSNPPSMGALEFTGSAASVPPVITYTNLNAVSYCTAVPPTLTATITSSAGINTTAGTKPRLYYKGSSDADAYGGSNNSTFDGWKYVEASNSSSPFSFTVDYSLLNHTATAGTVIKYFVDAQDTSGGTLVGYSQVAFVSGYCPTSVAIGAGAAPTSAVPVINSYTITAVPSFTATVAPSYYCGIDNAALLTVSPAPYDLQIQWLQDYGTGTFSNISGATTNAYGATPPAPPAIATPTATNVYEAKLSCNSSVVATSSTASATDYSPQVLTTTPASRCGTGTLTLGATGSTGSVLQWFAASTGGYPLGTGTSFVTPSISATTTYYVADSFGTYGNPQSVGAASLSGATLFAPSAGPGTGINFTVNNTCTIQSVTIYPYYSGATAAYSFTIAVYSGASVVASYTGTVAGAAGGGTPQVVPVNFYLLPGTYQMAFSALGANAAFQYGSATSSFPYAANFNTITLTSTTFSPYYFFFHNWQVKAGCKSARTAVIATINSLPDAGTVTGTPNPVCISASLSLSETGTPSGSGTMVSYAWSGPNSFSSSATATSVSNAVFSPTTTAASGIYSLTVTYPGTGCTSNPATTSYVTVNSTSSPTLGGTTNVCVGASTTLTTTISGGTWSSSNTGLATIDPTSGMATGISAGSLTMSYTTPCGVVATTAYTVNTTPSIITGTAAICTLTTTTLSDSVGSGTWTSGTPSVATINSSTGVAGASASTGVTIITYTIGSCTANFTLTVGSSGPAAITPGSPSVCVGSTTTLSDATGGGVWSSTNTALATINSSTGVATGVSNGSVTMSYSTGCGASTVSLTVNGTSVAASNNGPICTGTTLSLTGTVGSVGTYSWTGPNSFTSTSLSPTVSSATANAAGTYTFTATVGGCANTITTFANVDPVPTVTATVTPSTICSGGSASLTGAVTTPTSFGVISVPYSILSFTPTGTLTSGSGWSADNDDGSISVAIPFTFSFYGNSYSSVYVSANGYVTFGTAVTSGDYTAASLPSSAAGVPRNMIALFWHDTKVTSGSVTYGTTGTVPNRKFVISYNAIPDGSTSQTNSGEIILYETSNNIDLMVTHTTTAYTQTCGVQNNSGNQALTPPGRNNASYAVTGVGEGWRFETPSYGYTWSPATALSSTTIYNPISSGLTSTQAYTVTAADGYSGCTGSTASTTVNVVAQPAVSVIASTSALCTGGSITLTATPSGGTGTATYTWSGPGLSATTGTTPTPSAFVPTVGVTATGAYSVSLAYSGAGCTTATNTTSTVTVATQPVVTVSPSSTSICVGSNLTLTESTTSGGAGTATYTWSGPGISTTTGSSTTSPTFTPSVSSGAYSVSASFTGSGCNTGNGTTSTVTVNALPAITVGATPSVCQGATSANLSYTGATGSPTTYSITWNAGSLSAGFSNVSGASLGSSITLVVPGAAPAATYSGTLTVASASCTSANYSISVNVVAYPTGSITSAVAPCQGYATNVVFTGTSGASVTYHIDGGSNVTSTLTGGTYSLGTGALTSAHNFTLVNVHNSTCTSTYDSTITITPVQMQWVGGTSGFETDWNTTTNWTCGFVPTITDSAIILTGTTYSPVLATSGTATTSSLTVGAGANLTLNSSSTFNVKGKLTVNGTIAGTGTLKINNSTAQAIGGTGNVNYLELNNSAGATIDSGASIRVKKVLTITSGTLTTNDSLVLGSDSVATARVAPIGSGSISGNVKDEQYIIAGRRAFRFWSHPFSNYIALSQIENYIDVTGADGSANGFTTTGSNSSSAFSYDPTLGNSALSYDPGWQAFTNCDGVASINRLHQYQGMRLFYRGAKGEGLGYAPVYTISATTICMRGALNQGNQVVHMVKGGGANQDFNLLGNPYASPVDIGTIAYNAKASGNMVGAAFYVWNPYLSTTGQFQAIPVTTVSATPYYLQANAAFELRAGHNNDSLVFTESNKNATASLNLLRAIPEYVSLMVYDASYHPWDMLYVNFNGDASENEDRDFDAVKPMGPDFNFYSLSADDKKMAIDARPYVAEKVIPLGINSNYSQEFVIKAENIAVPEGGKVYLHDKMLQQYVLLQQGTEYRFTISTDNASQGDQRFELSLDPSAVTTLQNVKGLDVTMTPNPASDDVKISFTSGRADQVGIRVLDLSGVAVYENNLGAQQNGTSSIPLANLASGIYIVEVTSGNQKVIQRLVKE